MVIQMVQSYLLINKGVDEIISGPHPAGNVGVQIHHVDPFINKGDIVWYLEPQDVLAIWQTFLLKVNMMFQKL